MTTNDDSRPGPDDAQAAALAMAPRALVALAGACTLSGALGLLSIVAGFGAPPIVALLVPPALVVAAVPLWYIRSRRSEDS